MLATSPHLYHAVFGPLPPVPSRVPLYLGTVSTTTAETTTTFPAVNIGTPHPKRVVILAVYHGVTTAPTALIQGTPAVRFHTTQSGLMSIHWLPVPTGRTVDLAISVASSLRKAVSVYVAYPQWPLQLDTPTSGIATATAATADTCGVQAGGFIVYCGGGQTQNVTYVTTWTGPDPVIEDVDMFVGVGSYTAGRVLVSVASQTNSLTVTGGTSGTKNVKCASWGPPPP